MVSSVICALYLAANDSIVQDPKKAITKEMLPVVLFRTNIPIGLSTTTKTTVGPRRNLKSVLSLNSQPLVSLTNRFGAKF
jgi:hypothetical protein